VQNGVQTVLETKVTEVLLLNSPRGTEQTSLLMRKLPPGTYRLNFGTTNHSAQKPDRRLDRLHPVHPPGGRGTALGRTSLDTSRRTDGRYRKNSEPTCGSGTLPLTASRSGHLLRYAHREP
jgi:hypothetical protein